MTLKELSQYRYLEGEIAEIKQELKKTEEKAKSPLNSTLSDMPKAHSNSSYVEDCAIKIAQLKCLMEAKELKALDERIKLEKFIADIKHSKIRRIFTLRFVNGLKWDECAAKMGWRNTGKNLSNICSRYIKKLNNSHKNQK